MSEQGGPPGPSNARAPQLNVARVNALVTAVEELKEEIRKNKEDADKREQILYSVVKVLQAKVKAATARIEELMEYFGIEEEEAEDRDVSGDVDANAAAQGNSHSSSQSENRGAGAAASGPTPAQIKRSLEAVGSNTIKAVINKAFMKLMGVPKLTGPELPAYPRGMDKDDPDSQWPKDTLSGKPLLRFRWDEAHNSKVNDEGLTSVLSWIKASGRVTVVKCGPDLDDTLDCDLIEAIEKRWLYLRREARKHTRAFATGGETARGAGEDCDEEAGAVEENGEGQGQERTAATTAGSGAAKGVAGIERKLFASRAKGKLQQRIRKRAGTKYADSKYDAAFIVNAMSDDEDNPDLPFVDGKATGYISRAPGYRSHELQDLYDHIDELKDPNPDKERAMVPRIRGPEKRDAAPPRAMKLNLRVRAWQVNPAYLSDHPDWLESGRVAPSGIAWGDMEDPKEDERSSKEKVKGRAKKVRRIENTSDVADAQAKLDRVLGGDDVDRLFDI